jgi:hypothetical protein
MKHRLLSYQQKRKDVEVGSDQAAQSTAVRFGRHGRNFPTGLAASGLVDLPGAAFASYPLVGGLVIRRAEFIGMEACK